MTGNLKKLKKKKLLLKQENLDSSDVCLIKKKPKKKHRPSYSFDNVDMNPSILKSVSKSTKRISSSKKLQKKKSLKLRRKSGKEPTEKVPINSVFKPCEADLTPKKIEFAKIDADTKFTAKKELKKNKVVKLADQIDMTPYKDIKMTKNLLDTVEKEACNGKIKKLKNLFEKGSKKINDIVVSYFYLIPNNLFLNFLTQFFLSRAKQLRKKSQECPIQKVSKNVKRDYPVRMSNRNESQQTA